MSFFRLPLKAVDGLADRVVVIIGALLLSQTPAFISQYTQRLGGHVKEAERNVSTWQDIADENTDGDLAVLARRYEASVEPEVSAAGRKASKDVERLRYLREALAAIEQAAPWNRPLVFARRFDRDIAKGTWREFTPAMPLTAESMAYAFSGLVLGLLIYKGTVYGTKAGARRIHKRVKNSRAARKERCDQHKECDSNE